MTIQDLVDKQAAIIAARDATIAVLKAAADQRWRLLEELEQLVGFGFGDSGDPDKCEAAIRKIADWKTELRRRIIADRDNEKHDEPFVVTGEVLPGTRGPGGRRMRDD